MPHVSLADHIPVFRVGEKGDLMTAPHQIGTKLNEGSEMTRDAAGR